ncbi:CHAD domain-containing protein [Rhodocyclus tenuis]|uniref:CHAD domain-containing protein n=2 Tax=Rhodocyclus TaxID=1064 RepID=A0A6L5JWZ7_RHOTE|nr:CYTH and CHAD domain-containing protein [Rhodocyclus gracilis]MQY51749.1 CHAD domain-containing protein [Rhodocyclus gracilis]NJA88990.1 CHAD domain-containing protein [Rhodocyclus gracilis]
MPIETEIKLSLPARSAGQLLRHPVLAGHAPQRQRLANTYYDTATLTLLAARVAVRYRQRGWQYWLTVKCAAPAVGGLAQRNEWETPGLPGSFDFSAVDDAGLRQQLESVRADLQPVFSTDFTRRLWIIEPRPGARIELAFDRGQIRAGERQEAICEVELELLEGTVADLFALAHTLQETLPLHPEAASKAERGYRLFLGTPHKATKSRAIALAPDSGSLAAFRQVALACLEHLQGNERGVRESDAPEFVHQSRVAIRRLRSALRVWRPLLPADTLAAFDARWRTLAIELGEARNWDVFVTETLPPLLARFPDCAASARLQRFASLRRNASRKAARAALSSPEYGRLLLDSTAALLALSDGEASSLKAFAQDCLNKRARSVGRLATAALGADAPARHRLRVGLKRLRYAVEFFALLFPGRKLERYLLSAARLQDLLGHMNDLSVANELLASAPASAHSQIASGWLAGRDELMAREIDDAIAAFVSQPPPWKKG